LEKHKEYTHTNDYGNAQTAQNLEWKNNSSNTKERVLGQDSSNVSVLVIEDVEKRIGESTRCFSFFLAK
jgi:hypothetical protein